MSRIVSVFFAGIDALFFGRIDKLGPFVAGWFSVFCVSVLLAALLGWIFWYTPRPEATPNPPTVEAPAFAVPVLVRVTAGSGFASA